MSLNWNLKEIEGYEQKCLRKATQDDKAHGITKGQLVLKPVTDALIWASMPVGIGVITEKNYETFFARLRFWEVMHGAYFPARGFITLQEVRDHIGLRTNASKISDAKWRKEQMEGALDGFVEDAKEDERRKAKKAS